jgi:hypothetical protein
MRYLEQDQLEPTQMYFCVLYDGTSGYLRYVGNGVFDDDKPEDGFNFYNETDVRYVFNSIGDYVRSCRENQKDVVLVSIT